MPNIAALITVAAVMFAVLGAITLIAHIYNLNNIKSKTVGDGQHGTARWANKAEIRKTYRHIPFTPKKWRRQARAAVLDAMLAVMGLVKLLALVIVMGAKDLVNRDAQLDA